jgi:hypothetical protein
VKAAEAWPWVDNRIEQGVSYEIIITTWGLGDIVIAMVVGDKEAASQCFTATPEFDRRKQLILPYLLSCPSNSPIGFGTHPDISTFPNFNHDSTP